MQHVRIVQNPKIMSKRQAPCDVNEWWEVREAAERASAAYKDALLAYDEYFYCMTTPYDDVCEEHARLKSAVEATVQERDRCNQELADATERLPDEEHLLECARGLEKQARRFRVAIQTKSVVYEHPVLEF